MRFTRRNLILGLLGALGLDPPSFLTLLGGRGRELAQKLSGPELEDLLAFAEVLVEGRPLAPEERRYLIDHIEHRVKQGSGYYLDLYRTTVGLLGRLAQARLSSLDVAQRVALMTRHRLTSPDVRPGEQLGAWPEEAREVRTRAVPDLIGGYYGSPAGWAVVGYDAFPGRCGDLARYTGPGR